MERAKEIARTPDFNGRVVVADFQTQGRGTRGRSWVAPEGSCLMFSFVFQPRISMPALATLPVAIANLLRNALNAHFGANVAVDPPNDLVIGSRKLAGVLCQSHLRGREIEWVICGIGLNTNLTLAELSVPDTTSLAIECGGPFDHLQLLGKLLKALDPIRDC